MLSLDHFIVRHVLLRHVLSTSIKKITHFHTFLGGDYGLVGKCDRTSRALLHGTIVICMKQTSRHQTIYIASNEISRLLARQDSK